MERPPEPDLSDTPGRIVPESRFAEWLRLLGPVALILLTALAYANAAPDVVVHDDKFFFPYSHAFSSGEVLRFFSEDSWAPTGTRSGVYRPLLLLSIAFDNLVHGNDASGYHLTNILLHVAATLLLYWFLCALLGTKNAIDRLGALIAALVFGVHPIHTEAVDSIFNRSEMFATIGVLGSLYLLLRWEDRSPWLARTCASLVFLAALLCRESAATLPALAALILGLLHYQGDWRQRLRRLAPLFTLLIPLSLYLVFRSLALEAEPGDSTSTAVPEIAKIMLLERLTATITTLKESLRMVVWPMPLRASYADHQAAGILFALLIHLAMAGVFVCALKLRIFSLAAGLGFFYLAIVPSTRLFTDPSIAVPLAERYVYLPSAGLAIPLACGFSSLARWIGKGTMIAIGLGIFVAFLPLTLVRNAQWHDDITLFEAERRAAPKNGDALRLLTGAYLREKKHDKVVDLCDRHLKGHPGWPKLENHCAIAYANQKRFSEAERAYLKVVAAGTIDAVPHANLARMYLDMGRIKDAEAQFQRAIEAEREPAMRRYRRGHMLVRLYPDDPARLTEAEAEFEAALQLQPRLRIAKYWLDWTRNRLEGSPGRNAEGGD